MEVMKLCSINLLKEKVCSVIKSLKSFSCTSPRLTRDGAVSSEFFRLPL